MGRAFFYLPVPIVGANASSAAAGFDPANVANDHMGVVYKSAGGTDTVSIIVDLGSPQMIDTALLFGCTGAQPSWIWQVDSASNLAFTSDVTIHTTASSFLAGSASPTHGRGVALWAADNVPAAKRYWRFTIGSLANAAVTIARIALGQRITLARNFAFGGAFGVRDLGSVNFSPSGVRLLRQASKLRTVGITFPAVTKEEAEAKVQPLVEQAAGQMPIVLVTDPDAHPLRQRRCWFGQLTGELGTIWRSAQAWEWRASLIDLVPIPAGAGGAIDATEPLITSPATFSVNENVALSQTATADAPVTWSKGGLDAGLITLNSATGAWSLPAQDYEARQSVSFVLSATKQSNGLSAIQPITVTIGDVVEGGSDTTPDAFSFADAPNVALGSTQASDWRQITGINAPAAASVTGGQWQSADDNSGTNATALTTSNGMVAPNKWVRVQHTASSSNGTAVNTTLTIGGLSDTFTSTTVAAAAGAPTYDPSLVPLYIQLDGDRNSQPLKVKVFTDKTHDLGGSIWTYAYSSAALTNPAIFKVTPSSGQAASDAIAELNVGLAALTDTQRIETYWVTASNRISRPSNLLIWGPNDVAPVLSAGTQPSNVTATSADFSINTNMSGGTLKGVVVKNGIAPSQAQILAGQNSAGAAVDWALSQSVIAAGPQNAAPFGLQPATSYQTWFVHVPAVGPASAPFRGPDVTTAAASVFSVEYLGGFRMAGGFPTTIQGIAIGAPDSNRQIFIQSFNYGDQPNFRVEGQLATMLPPGDRGNRAYVINVPLGTTADIALEAGFVSGTAAVAIWRVVGGAIQTPPAMQGGFQEVANQRVAITTPEGAATLVAGWTQNGTATGFSGATLQERIVWEAQGSTGALYVGQRTGPSSANIALTGGNGTTIDMVAYNITPAA